MRQEKRRQLPIGSTKDSGSRLSIPRLTSRSKGKLYRSALTKHFSDVSDGNNGDESLKARTNFKFCELVFVESCHITDRHFRFFGKELDGGVLMGLLAGLCLHSEIDS